MSKTIDERVVEMRFDNKQFESNVATSMSTLEKLKRSLKLDDAAKGLEGINTAARKVDMSGLGGSVDSIKAKFSALDVMAVTALANITNSAINAGKRVASALTIDPIKSGFQEYETQINAVQTILANTSSKGTTIDDVTAALDELNHYADLTIYNFTEMTRNIGTFTAAGIDLETSVSAIQGIANLAAVSGSTSQQASVAMYQLSQALASGTVKLMDWNSVVNAGMGGEVFQNALKETSRLLNTGADAAIEANGSFRESLKTGWLTSEVLTETLKKFTTSGANEYVAEYTGLSVDAVQAALDNAKAQYGEAEAIEKASQALAEKSGKNKDEIKSVLQMAQTATDAATKVKTFTQLWDVLKEAAQSGWAKTWQIIIGDFEQAKDLLTPLSDKLTAFINKMSDWRNDLLESALGKSFSSLGEKITGALTPVKKVAETVTETVSSVTDAVSDLGDIVDKVILGDFGNGADRFNALTEAGENYYRVQNKVNETLNNSFRYSEEQIASQDKLLGKQKETVEATKETAGATSESQAETVKLTDAQKEQIKSLAKLSEEQLRSKGYTEKQIEALNELRSTAEKLGIPLDEFIGNLDEINGRWLLMNSFKNIGQSLIQVFTSIGKAWRDIFEPIQSDSIFNIIAAFHKLTASLIPSEETAEKLTRTFRGLFAVLDIIRTIVGGGINVAFKILSKVLSAFHLDILDVTASVGDALVSFRDWLLEGNALSQAINSLIARLPSLIEKFKEWFDTFKKSSFVQSFLTSLTDAYKRFNEFVQKSVIAIRKWFTVFKETEGVKQLVQAVESLATAFENLFSGQIDVREFARTLGNSLANLLTSLPKIALQFGRDFIAGFSNGIGDGISKVINSILKFCSDFISAFAEALGIHSPSWISYQNAVDWWQGFINGCKDMFGPIIAAVEPIVEYIKKIFTSFWSYITDESGNIEWGKILTGAFTIEALIILKQFTTALDKFASAATSFTSLIDAARVVVTKFGDALTRLSKSMAFDLKADGIMKLAIAIGILVASIWILCQIGTDNLGDLIAAVVTIGVLAGILVALAVAVDRMTAASISITKNGAALDGLKTGLIQIGLAMLMLAAVVKIIGGMSAEEADRGMTALLEIAIGMITFLGLMGVISLYAKDVSHFGSMMIKMSVALGIMAIVMKMLSRMDTGDILVGVAVMQLFAVLCMEMGLANRFAGQTGNGSSFLAMAVAMGIMVIVMKMLKRMEPEDIVKGITVMQLFVVLMAEMALVNRLAGTEAAKFGGTIAAMATSMLILAGTLLILSKLDDKAVSHGIKVMQHFVLVIAELVLISRLAGKESAKIAGNLLGMATAIGILAGICVLLSYVSEEDLQKGLRVVSELGLIMAAMIWATRGVQNIKGNLVAMSVAIGVMAAAVVALSFIDDSDLAGATAAIGSLMLIFGLMTKLAAGANASLVSLIIMIAVVGALATVLWVLSGLDPTAVLGVVASLSTLMLAFSASLAIMSTAGAMGVVALPGIAIMIGVVTILGLLIAGLSCITNIDAALKVAGALSILMLAMSVSLGIMSIVGPLGTAALPGIGIMILVLAAVAAAIGILCGVTGIDAALKVAGALSILLLSLSAACFIMAAAASMMAGAVVGAKQLLIVLGVMVAILATLAVFSAMNPEGTIAVMKTMGQAIGEFIGGIITGVANAAIGLLPAIGQALSDFMTNVKPFIDTVSTIGPGAIVGAGYLTAAILLLTAADFLTGLVSIFTLGQGSLGTVGEQLKAFGEGAKATFDVIQGVGPDAVTAASNVATMIQTLSECDTSRIAALDFESIKTKLSAFGSAVVDFSDKITGKINAEAVQAAVSAGELFVALNNSLPKSGGFVQDIIGEQDFEKFSTACRAFANCMIDINAAVSQEGFAMQSEKISQLITAGTQFAELNTALPRTGGIAQDLAGEQDLAAFGAACVAFANCMAEINAALSQEGFVVQSEKISQLVVAGERFNDLNTALPRTGGIAQDLAGEQDLATFGAACVAFASCMAAINAAVSQEGFAINLEAIESLKQAGLKMNELQEALPKSGGWIQTIAGEQDIGNFGTKIKAFGHAMSDFSTTVTELDTGHMDTAITAANRIKTLSNQCAELDTSGLYVLSTGIGQLGTTMATFGKKVIDIDAGKVTTTVSVAMRLKTLIASLAGLDASGVENFKPNAIGSAMKEYSDKVAGIDAAAVSSSISSAVRLKTFITSLAGLDTSGIGTFTSAINKLASVNISAVVEAFSGATDKLTAVGANMIDGLLKGMLSRASSVGSTATNLVASIAKTIVSKAGLFDTAGKTLMAKLASGIVSKKSSVNSAVSACLSDASNKIRSYYGGFYNSGAYLVMGFCNGISENSWRAESKARAMARKAKEAAEAELEIKSPSKVFKRIGAYVPQGFAIGIGMYDDKVTDAAANMASSAINATRSAMSTVLDALNGDIDAQPTIRPVVDLSDVQTGADAINGLFNSAQTMGVQSNLNAIGSRMNAMRQNGSNDDVVLAINKLRDKLDGLGNTYNTVNGVTYDDGSNVTDAVETLVRYAKIGRRV